MRYEAFGLQIDSEIKFSELFTSRSFPLRQGFGGQVSVGRPDVKIQQSVITSPTFEIPGVGRFQIPDDSHIFFDGTHLDPIRPFLLGTAMGILLQKRGYLVLHGNAIAHDNQCVVFMGPSGAGKSTLTGCFMRAGYHVLTDDVCAIRFNPGPEVIPSYPQIKLWKDSAELLGYDIAQLKPLFERENKFAIPLGEQFCSTPKPIKKIYLLGESPLNRFQKLASLIQNTYRLQFLETPEEHARHLELCQMLLQHVPIQSLLHRPPLDGGSSWNHWVSNLLC